MTIARRMTSRPLWAALSLAAAACAGAGPAAAQTVGSASLATLRKCSSVGPGDACDGSGPGQTTAASRYGGGVGVAGLNELDVGSGNRAFSDVSFGSFDLPVIRAATQASGNVRMNINVFAFQSYLVGGTGPTPFSVAGTMHIVDSSTNPSGTALPGGAHLTAYLGIWDAAILAGYGSDPQSLFGGLFYAGCGTPGVLGTAFVAAALPGGEQSFGLSTVACSPGSLTFTPGQELLVVAGMQLPVNRGGFVDATHTFTTGLDPAVGAAGQAQVLANAQSAIVRGAQVVSVPEPSSALLLVGGLMGFAAWRRRR